MNASKDLSLVKLGSAVLIIGCTIGVTIAAQAANKALGATSIAAIKWQSGAQGGKLSVFGWQNDIHLPAKVSLTKASAELVNEAAKIVEKQAPVLENSVLEQKDVMLETWQKYQEKGLPLIRKGLDTCKTELRQLAR